MNDGKVSLPAALSEQEVLQAYRQEEEVNENPSTKRKLKKQNSYCHNLAATGSQITAGCH